MPADKLGLQSVNPTNAANHDEIENQARLVEFAQDAILVRDTHGVILFWNLGAEQLYGWTKTEARGRIVQDLLRAEYPKPLKEIETQVLQAGAWEGQIIHATRTGRRVVEASRWALHRDLQGRPLGFLEINRDITDEVRALEAMEEQVRLLELAHDAIIVREKNSAVKFWNSGAEHLYGWTRKEAFGKITHDLLQTEFPEQFDAVNDKLFNSGVWEGELWHVTRDGARICVLSRQVIQRDRDGQTIGILEINRDITDRKNMEESLRHLSARLLQLQDEERRRIARELHDSTGQTLAAMVIHLSALKARVTEMDAQAQSTLEEVAALAQQAATEIRTISYLLHPPQLDFSGLTSTLQWFVEGFARRSNIQVNLEISSQLGRLSQAIETTVFRIVQEALSNVFRHSESPEATVRVVLDAKQLQVEVADKGKGISPEVMAALKAKGGGLGVGLLGMGERVRQFGGTFHVSRGTAGTTVRATFPASAIEDGKS
jgi:PAS domain S-box-containing protein